MRFVLTTALVLTVLPPASLPGQPPAQPQRVPEIAVSAQGESRANPDRAVVTMGVQTRAATAAEAAAENASRQRDILDTLKRMGFGPEQLSTANFTVRPEYAPGTQTGTPRVTGYVVSNNVQVTLNEIGRAAEVIDAALAHGANTVYGLSFQLADPGPARREALREAFAKAREEAELLAEAAGGRLGDLIELTTSPAAIGSMQLRAAGGMIAGGNITPLEPGLTAVRAVVTARWRLVPRR